MHPYFYVKWIFCEIGNRCEFYFIHFFFFVKQFYSFDCSVLFMFAFTSFESIVCKYIFERNISIHFSCITKTLTQTLLTIFHIHTTIKEPYVTLWRFYSLANSSLIFSGIFLLHVHCSFCWWNVKWIRCRYDLKNVFRLIQLNIFSSFTSSIFCEIHSTEKKNEE